MQKLLSLIMPSRCFVCGTSVDGPPGFCGACRSELVFLDDPKCAMCSAPLIGHVGMSDLARCDACLETARSWDWGRAVLRYAGAGRRYVLALKHGGRLDLVAPAARWMAATLPDCPPSALIVPVPLHSTRLMRRKYNQAAELARGIRRESGFSTCMDALVRKKMTPILKDVSRAKRFELLQDAIEVHPKRRHRLIGRDVILVDDVMTSGATLSACADKLRSAGARSIGVSLLARATKDA